MVSVQRRLVKHFIVNWGGGVPLLRAYYNRDLILYRTFERHDRIEMFVLKFKKFWRESFQLRTHERINLDSTFDDPKTWLGLMVKFSQEVSLEISWPLNPYAPERRRKLPEAVESL